MGEPETASCLVPAASWFDFDRSVSTQIAIGQPVKKKCVDPEIQACW